MAVTVIPSAPRWKPVDKRQVELNFSGTIVNGAFNSVVAGPIPYKFRILLAKMIFTDDANNLVEHGWYISANNSVSTTGPPSGDNVFGRENPTQLFIGDNLIRVANCNVVVDQVNMYIKLYVHNTCGATYTFNCAMIIQEL